MPPFFVDFFLPFFFVGTYFFTNPNLSTLLKMASYWKSSVSILEEVGIREDLLRRTTNRFQTAVVK